jgi:hypothetical protein
MIWHILRKDLRRLWLPASVACILLACLAMLDAWRFDYEVGLAETALNLLVPLAWSVLIALAVQLDPLTSDKAFWLTRPFRRSSLVAAKVLFCVATVHLPMLASDAAILMTHGFSPLDASLFSKQLLVLFAVTVPSLAVASVTSTVAGFGWCALAGAAVGLVLNTALVGHRFPWTQTDWMPGALALLLVALGGAAMIAVQYARRWALAARAVGIGIAAGAVLTFSYVPRDLTGAMQCAFEPDLNGPVDVRYEPGADVKMPVTRIPPGRVAVSLPVRLTSLGQSERVLSEQLFLRVTGQGGRSWEVRRDLSPDRRAHLAVDPQQQVQAQFLLPERSFVQALGTTPVRVDGRISVRPLRTGPLRVLPATFEQTDVPKLGRCSSTVQAVAMFGIENLKVTCEAPGELPPATRVTLRDPATGREWKQGLGDAANFRSFPAFAWLSPLERRQTFLQIVDSDSSKPGDRWLVPRSVLDRSQMTIQPTIIEGCANVSYSFTVPNLQERIAQMAR